MMLNNLPGSRIFLNPQAMPIPGFVISPGMVRLPMFLNGGSQIADIGLKTKSLKTLAEGLYYLAAFSNDMRFPNWDTKFIIYKNFETFQAKHKPPWITGTSIGIHNTIRDYIKKNRSSGLPTGTINWVDNLTDMKNSLLDNTHSIIYAGPNEEGTLTLDPLSLFITGTPTIPEELSGIGALHFIHCIYNQIEMMFGWSLRYKYATRNVRGKVFDLPDPLQEMTTDEEIDRIPPNGRTLKIFELNKTGNFAGSDPEIITDKDFEDKRQTAENMLMGHLGMYLFAHYNFTPDDINGLLIFITPRKRIPSASKLDDIARLSHISAWLSKKRSVPLNEAKAMAPILAFPLIAIKATIPPKPEDGRSKRSYRKKSSKW